MSALTKYRVHIARYRALPSGRDTTRGQWVRVDATDEDTACEVVRREYGDKPYPWLPGVQVNRVERIER
jgi:hypothetical protein